MDSVNNDLLDDQEPVQQPAAPKPQADDSAISYDQFKDKLADQFGIPKNLVKGMIAKESGGNVDAKGIETRQGRAMGDWQVMPKTFDDAKKRWKMDHLKADDPFDRAYVGARYLRERYDEAPNNYDDDRKRWADAVSRYHGGGTDTAGNVRAKKDGVTTTDRHVDQVMRNWAQYERANPDPYYNPRTRRYEFDKPPDQSDIDWNALNAKAKIEEPPQQQGTLYDKPAGPDLTAGVPPSKKTLYDQPAGPQIAGIGAPAAPTAQTGAPTQPAPPGAQQPGILEQILASAKAGGGRALETTAKLAKFARDVSPGTGATMVPSAVTNPIGDLGDPVRAAMTSGQAEAKQFAAKNQAITRDVTNPVMKYGVNPAIEGVIASAPAIAGMAAGVPAPVAFGAQAAAESSDKPWQDQAIDVAKAVAMGKILEVSSGMLAPFAAGIKAAIASRIARGGIVGTAAGVMEAADHAIKTGQWENEDLFRAGVPMAIIAALTGSARTATGGMEPGGALVPTTRGGGGRGGGAKPGPDPNAGAIDADFVDIPAGGRAPIGRLGPAPEGTAAPSEGVANIPKGTEPILRGDVVQIAGEPLGGNTTVRTTRNIQVTDADSVTVRGIDQDTGTPHVWKTKEFESLAGRPVYTEPERTGGAQESKPEASPETLETKTENAPETKTTTTTQERPQSEVNAEPLPAGEQGLAPKPVESETIPGERETNPREAETKQPGPETKPAEPETGGAVQPPPVNPPAAPGGAGGTVGGTTPATKEEKKPEPPPPPGSVHNFSSTQVNLPPEVAAKVKAVGAKIPDSALAEDGRETAPHVTVKYGLHDENPDKIRDIVASHPPINVTIGKTSIFPDDGQRGYDVVKADVDSPALHKLNKAIADAAPHTDTYPTYQPHVTIAYVKPGEGQKYADDNSLEGTKLTFNSVEFSGKNGHNETIPLGGSAPAVSQPATGETAPAPTAPRNQPASPMGKALMDEPNPDAIKQGDWVQNPSIAKGQPVKVLSRKRNLVTVELPDGAKQDFHTKSAVGQNTRVVPGPGGAKPEAERPLTPAEKFHQKSRDAAERMRKAKPGDLLGPHLIGQNTKFEVVSNNGKTIRVRNIETGNEFDQDVDTYGWDTIESPKSGPVTVTEQVPGNQVRKSPEIAEPIGTDQVRKPEAAVADHKDLVPGTGKLIDRVSQAIAQKEKMDNPILNKWAQEFFGGAIAEGKYNPKDAYDAVETAVNRWVLEHGKRLLEQDVKESIAEIEEMTKLLPTQRADSRTAEQQELQQFSTPPLLSFLVAKAGAIKPSDVVLEPSAGTGSLAVWAKAAGATVHVNEKSVRRRALLEFLGFEKPTGADAEFLDSTLKQDIRPTLVLMNPPFSATGGRTSNDPKYGARHFTEALRRLVDNGRLVGITGEGMALDKMTFIPWWKDVATKYNVRANIGMDGRNYAKYGTTFNNQLLIFDKTGPTPGENWRDQANHIKLNDYKKVDEALNAISQIIQDRPEAQAAAPAPKADKQAPAEPAGTETGPVAPDTGEDVGSAGSGTGPGGQSSAGRGTPGNRQPGGLPAESGVTGTEGSIESVPGEKRDTAPGDRADKPTVSSDNVAVDVSDAGIKLEERKEESGGKFVEYVPYKVKQGAPHPSHVVESAAMGAIEPPDPHHVPKLFKQTGPKKLSNVQIESIVYAGQRHDQVLPSGERAGYFIGDGTGVGKGMTIAGIIGDNYNHGRKRALWVSKAAHLGVDAERDLKDAGMESVNFIRHHKVSDVNAAIENKNGVLFTSYDLLKGGGKNGKRTRLAQIKEWLGPDGVIIFDEAHQAQNVVPKEGQDPSQVGEAVLKLQEEVPNARVVYVSATGATEARQMGYMTRLGLWGEGTAFPGGFEEFLSQASEGGVGMMEMISRDMKALGMYASRSLSFDGVEYEPMEIKLTDDQREMYDAAAEAWQVVMANIPAAIDIANGGKRQRSYAMSRFWADQQRFERTLITSIKVPEVIKRTQKALDAGQQVVISLIGTGEAQADRQIKKAIQDETDFEDLDMSPREILLNFLVKSFPIIQNVEVPIAGSNKTQKVPLLDAEGNPVINQEALRMRDKLIARFSDMKMAAAPLDQIINHFENKGVKVAELTGRKKKLMKNKDGKLELLPRAPVAAKLINDYERDRFQKGVAQVAIISQACAEGISLHAERGSPTANKRRVQIAIELDWSATKQMQTFGRTHRSNQESAPIMVMPYTEIAGEKRFVSTMAKRLAGLGAVTKGQRDAATADDDLSKYNFFTPEGAAATDATYQYILGRSRYRSKIPNEVEKEWSDKSMHREVVERMGILKVNPDTGEVSIKDEDMRDTERFFNRILALPLTEQNKVYRLFAAHFDHLVRTAKENGTFDDGVVDFKAKSIRVAETQTVNVDKTTGAKTEHKRIEYTTDLHPYPWKDVKNAHLKGNVKFYKQKRSGRVIAAEKRNTHTDDAGKVHQMYGVFIPENINTHDRINEDELQGKYDSISLEDAQAQWEEKYEAAPREAVRNMHLIAGAVTPIMNRLKAANANRMEIIRTKADNGDRIVGVEIPAGNVSRVLRALGVGGKLNSAESVLEAVMGNEEVHLTENLSLMRSKLQGGPAIKVLNTRYKHDDLLKKIGLIDIRNYGTPTWYIPTDPELAIPMLERFLKSFPVDHSYDETPIPTSITEAKPGIDYAPMKKWARSQIGIPEFKTPKVTAQTPTADILDNIKIQVIPATDTEPLIILGNVQAAIVLDYLRVKDDGFDRFEPRRTPEAGGMALLPEWADWMARRLDKLAGEQKDLTFLQKNNLRHIAAGLKYAKSKNEPVVFVDADDAVWASEIAKVTLHELVHIAQARVGNLEIVDLVSSEWAEKDPDYSLIAKARPLRHLDPARRVTEAVAYILSGDRVRMGYTNDKFGMEAASDFVSRYFAEVAKKHGPFILSKFHHYHPDFRGLFTDDAKIEFERRQGSSAEPKGEADANSGDAERGEGLQGSLPEGGRGGGLGRDTEVIGENRRQGYRPNQSGAIPLNIRWGKDEVKIAGEAIGKVFGSGFDDVLSTFSPHLRGVSAKQTKPIVREEAAKMAQKWDKAEAELKEASKVLGKLPELPPQGSTATTIGPAGQPGGVNSAFLNSKWGFVYAVETGTTSALDPKLKPFADIMRRLLDERRAEVQALGTGKLQAFYEDYFPHIWEDPKKAQSVMATYFGKRPFEGSKSFLKQRTIPTIEHGRALGLVPISSNPVDLVMLKIREIDRYIMAHRVLNEMHDEGLTLAVKPGQKPPPNWAKIEDKVAILYGPQAIPGMLQIRGHLYAPEPAARLLNNFLSPGLRGKPWFRGWLSIANALNQLQLGWSAFHFGFTSIDAMVSKFGLGINKALNGNITGAIAAMGETPVAAVSGIYKGYKTKKAWISPGSAGPRYDLIAQAMVAGGGRAKMDTFYKSGAINAMKKAFAKKSVVSSVAGVALSPFAATEFMSKLLMEHVVPYQKMGVFMDLAEAALEKNPNMSHDEFRHEMSKIWDSVDNRMGQMVYDNLFWDKMAKDLAMSAVRSVGWNLGTIRELGGGAIDAAKMVSNVGARIGGRGGGSNRGGIGGGGGGGGKPPQMRSGSEEWFGGKIEFTYRMQYIVSMLIVTGLIGGMMNYLLTGEPPKEFKDYYFPRTGKFDDEGNPQRVNIPSYFKDLVAYSTHPALTISHKLHPLLGVIGEILSNKDFYNVEIRNPRDSYFEQGKDIGKHFAKSFIPFSVRNTMEMKDRGEGVNAKTTVLPFIGFTPASKELGRTKAEQMVHDLIVKRFGNQTISEESFDASRHKRQLRIMDREGKDISGILSGDIDAGRMTEREAMNVLKANQSSWMERSYKQLDIDDALDVFEAASKSEKEVLGPLLAAKEHLVRSPKTEARFQKALQ